MIPTTTLPIGAKLQTLGYGTGTAWIRDSEDEIDRKVVEAFKEAIALGYRHLDCAQYYKTEAEVGVAIAESGTPRQEFFITTKAISPLDVEGALKTSLEKLQTDYVDLYLQHEPFSSGGKEDVLQDAWQGMESCLTQGLAKNIGVSHYREGDLESIMRIAKVKPAVNQLEVHPYLQRPSIRDYCLKHDIAVHAFAVLTPLTSSKGGEVDGVVQRLATKYASTASTVLLRWAIDQGMVVITTSGKTGRLQEYLNKTWEFQLTEDEIMELSNSGKGRNFRGFMEDGYGALCWE